MSRMLSLLPGLGLAGLATATLLATPAQAQPQPEQVTMTLDQFLRLYEQGKDRKPDVVPPRAYTLSAARYVGDVVFEDGEPVSATFTARMTVENLLERGWARVPLLSGAVGVQSARIGGKEASMVLENGQYVLVTDQRGAFEVVVQFAVAVTSAEGRSGFSFPLEASGATEVELAVPTSEELDFTVANAKLAQSRVRGNRRVVTATLPSSGSLAVSWQRDVPDAEKQQDPRVYAEVHTRVGVGEGVLTANVTLEETILFAGIDEVRAQIPTDMTVLDVRGAGLRDWTLGDDGVLVASLNYAAEDRYTLSIDLERVLIDGEVGESGQLNVPLVEPVGVERSKGFVGVQSRGTLELTAGAVQGAAVVDVRTLPASILGVTDQPVLLGFKYLGSDADIPLSVREYEDVDVLVTLLDQGEATTMFTADGRRLTRMRYQVRNNRRQFLRLTLPKDAELWSSAVAGRAVQPARSQEGELLVPLVRSQAAGGALAAFDVEIVYVESGEGPNASGSGTFMAELPKADAPTTWVGWTVYAPRQAKIEKRKKRDGSLRPVDGLSRPASAAQALQIQSQNAAMQQSAGRQFAEGAMGLGAAPVQVSVPVDGQPVFFEKLLALDERLWVEFDYKKLD